MLARRMSMAEKNPTDLLRMKFRLHSSQWDRQHMLKNILFSKERFYLSCFIVIPLLALLIGAINVLLYIWNVVRSSAGVNQHNVPSGSAFQGILKHKPMVLRWAQYSKSVVGFHPKDTALSLAKRPFPNTMG